MSATAALLPEGRLHLQHGPIDLVIGVDGARAPAYRAAQHCFAGLLQRLVDELPQLRQPVGPALQGPVARRMRAACLPFAPAHFVTPMAAVAGAVADQVLHAMCAQSAPIHRAYVNNGGDIALYLAPGGQFDIAVAGLDGHGLGRIALQAAMGVGGIATSGRGGRSLSMGVADSVTVLAKTAAAADVAATLIANAVDLPGHPAIARQPACVVQPDSDLGTRPVVVGLGPLAPAEAAQALANGMALAHQFHAQGHILGAVLCLQGQTRIIGAPLDAPLDAAQAPMQRLPMKPPLSEGYAHHATG